ncbi:MAG: hypothetical protein H7242_02025 [Microbacteriaceae bacterium]|nr:hypothetical protein [Burkholderiaceae bacterium]
MPRIDNTSTQRPSMNAMPIGVCPGVFCGCTVMDKGSRCARAKASTGAAAASQADSVAVSAAAWLVGPNIVRTAASVRSNPWNMVVTLIDGDEAGCGTASCRDRR